MKTIKMKLLDATLIGLLAAGAVGPAAAQTAPVAGTAAPAVATLARTAPQVAAPAAGRYAIDLPGGGAIWATEDPTLGQPVLAVQAAATAPFADGRVQQPLRFHGYSNYAAFIKTLQVRIYRASDTDLVSPLATVDLPVGATGEASWDGALPAGTQLRAGDELIYVARATDAEGRFDETRPQRVQLVTPADYDRGVQATRQLTRRTLGQALDGEAAQALQIEHSIYGQSQLRVQTIPVYGSRVRVSGRGLPLGSQVRIDGQSIPVDQEGRFVAEFLEPVGQHRYDVQVKGPAGEASRTLDVDVTGRYAFLVALADVTVSKNRVGGSVEPLAGDERFDDGLLSEGRLAFYLKGKVKGKYLITAQADTRERELGQLFTGFLDADAQDVFRRLDPDAYYPVYGDDSTTVRDVDTQGKLYVRVDWDRNQALWGNFNTGLTGTEYGQYNRSLYGAALDWRSRGTTALGEPASALRAFAAQAQSAPGHSEFLGTGGSLYYLRHTDLLPGSDKVVLEVRDPRTGRVEARVDLQRGADYDIDELQGRVILTRPLSQITRENVRSITRDTPLDGFEQRLLADYEYVPTGYDADHASVGLRGRQWIGEHVAVGATYVDENRQGEDYSLRGADLTLQAGRGTYLKLEQSRTESTAAPVFFSDNGGLGFVQRNAAAGLREGEARAVEARANLRELGWTQDEWTAGAWWRDVGAGYSESRFDTGLGVHEYGAEVLGRIGERLGVLARHSRAERGASALSESQLTLDWRLTGTAQLAAEVRRVREQSGVSDVAGTLAALSYRQEVTPSLQLYGTGQITVDDDHGAYARNNLATLGAKYQFGDRSSLGAEASSGSRGQGGRVEGEYRLAADHTLYGSYAYSTDRTGRDPLFDNALRNGWTVGQRWRLSDQVNVFNESQSIRDPQGSGDGVAHTFGLDFYPAPGWTAGFTVMDGQLDAATGTVDRRAYSVSGGRTDPSTQWSSKLEYRQDSGAEQREQWVTTNRLFHRLNEDWRIAARMNYADTQDALDPAADAKLVEGNLGFAWRPHDSTRWAAFGKYTYLYDLATLGQEGGATYDQRSQVLALEGIAQLGTQFELAGKLASRWGEFRMDRGAGPWLDSRADFAAVQLRYHLVARWDGMAEYRWLGVQDGGDRRGWLVGLDRQLGENFKLGVGYNFTDFSDDLTELRYEHRGWFLNLAGYY